MLHPIGKIESLTKTVFRALGDNHFNSIVPIAFMQRIVNLVHRFGQDGSRVTWTDQYGRRNDFVFVYTIIPSVMLPPSLDILSVDLPVGKWQAWVST